MSLFEDSVEIRYDLDVGILKTFDSPYRNIRRSFLSCISKDGSRMFFAEISGIEGKCIMYLIDLKSGRVVIEGRVDASMVVCADYSHDDKTIALACSTSDSSVFFKGAKPEGKLILIDPKTLNTKREMILEDAGTRLDFGACKFYPGNESLIFVEVSANKSKHTYRIGLLDINTLAFVWTVSGESVTFIPQITFSRYYNCLIVKDAVDGFLKSVDAVKGNVISSSNLAYHHFRGINVSHSGNIVAVKHLSFNRIWLLDAMSLELIREVPFGDVRRVVFTKDDEDILVWGDRAGTRGGVVSRIDMRSGTVDSVVTSPFETTNRISMLNDGTGRFVADFYKGIAIFHPKGVKSYMMSNTVVAAASGIKKGLFLPGELWALINNKFAV